MKATTGTLLLSRQSIATLATTRDYLSAMEQAFAMLANGACGLPPVGHIACADGAFHIKSAVAAMPASLAAIKVNGNFPGNAAKHGLPTIQGFIALLDGERGTVLALMDSIEITARRTAAATALAARCLARPDSAVVAIVGCGVQAGYHLEALLDVVKVRQVAFCDPRDAAAAQFAAVLERREIEHYRASDAAVASRNADVIVTLTPSTRPVLSLSDVKEGTFVAGVGADNPAKHELAADLLEASRVVPDVLAQASTMGDLHHAIRSGCMTADDIHGELGQIATGRVPGRVSPDERFVFDSTGVAIQDLAASAMIYARALARGDVPTIDLGAEEQETGRD